MHRTAHFLFALCCLASASAAARAQGAAAQKPVKVTEDKPGLLKRAKISADSAIKLAEAAVPTGRVTKGEIEEEKGKLIYSFDIKVPGKGGIEEIHIDPATGVVVGREHEDDAKAPAPAKKKP